MTDLQLYILVAIPLVGILANTALFIHVSGRVDRMAERIDTALDAVKERLNKLENRVTALETLFGIVLKKLDELETRMEAKH